jgi:hypothetical protein
MEMRDLDVEVTPELPWRGKGKVTSTFGNGVGMSCIV